MAINTIFKTVNTDYERTLDGKQIVTQCNFDTQSRGGVSKLCVLTGDVQITKVQTLSKQIKISGRLALKLVYLDGEKKLNNFDYISDFAEDINDDQIVAEMPCIVKADIVDIQSAIAGNEIKVQTVIELVPNIVEIATSEIIEEAEGALTLKEEQSYQKYIGMVEEECEISEEYACGVKVEDILLYDTKAIVCEVNNDDGKLCVSGKAEITLVYKAEGIVSTKNMSLPFMHELKMKGENLNACISVKVKESKLVIEGDENDNILKSYVTLCIRGFVMQRECVNAVVDLYSPSHELEISKNKVCFMRQGCMRRFEERISGSVAVDDDDSIESILSTVVTQNSLSNLVAMDGEVLAEGVVNTSVIYLNDKGENKCMQVELPYSLQFACEGMQEEVKLSGMALVSDCTYKKKRDREVEISLTVELSVCTKQEVEQCIISKVEEGEECEHNHNAVSIYLPDKGETIWQVAKTLGMSIESIKEQNPDIANEMQGDERIVIYREIV